MVCKNCNQPLSQNHIYCEACGGKVIRNRLTMKNLFADFSERFLNYDNTFLKTFIHLFTKPEDVIGGYIDGMRKKYVNVISYFAIAITLSGLQIFILNKFFPEVMNLEMMSGNGMEKMQQDNISFTQEYQSILYMLLVPIYAFMSKLVFMTIKKFNYTEHIVINMYLSAHFSIVSSITVIITAFFGINYMVIAFAIIALQILYSAYVFKRLYQMSWGGIILRTLLFFLIMLVLIIVLLIIGIIIGFLYRESDTMQELIKSQKTALEAQKIGS